MEESENGAKTGGLRLPPRLKSERLITRLFEEGWVEGRRPLTLRVLPIEELQHTQFLFAAPKRRFRQATVRNQVKRRMKEALRLEWPTAPESLKSGYGFALLCLSTPPPSVAALRTALRALWPKLEERGLALGTSQSI